MFVIRKRSRRFVTVFVLASWLFAIFANVAHACSLGEDLGQPFHTMAVGAHGHDLSDDDACPGCEPFCADELAVLAKLKAIQDPPTGQTLLAPAVVGNAMPIAAQRASSFLPSPDHPPGIAVNTRFTRLAL